MRLSAFFQMSCGPAAVSLMENKPALQSIVLWGIMCGVALVWLLVCLKRNARFRALQKACESVQRQQEDILQCSQDILYQFNLSARRFDYVSSACVRLTGYAPEELEQMGREGLLACVHPDDREALSAQIEKLQSFPGKEEWKGEVSFRFLHRDQQYRSFSAHVFVRYDSAGQARIVSGAVQDLTRVSRLSEHLRAMDKKVHDTQKMAEIGLLASGIAHDFNNMMTVVIGNAELALERQGCSDIGVLDEIRNTSLRAAELANQLLVYAGKTKLVLSDINLCSIVREMGALLEISVSKKVTIEYNLDDDLPLIQGDISQIRQVAMNLITNASEAIGDREGIISVTIHETNLQSEELARCYPYGNLTAGAHVLLQVSDTGCGMDHETLEHIFDPHFTTKLTGRGLGLASLINAVQRHNGALKVDSEPEKGTVFRIYFPIEKQQEARPEASSTDKTEGSDARQGAGTVLIADDEEAILQITTVMLKRLGFQTLTAIDGKAAVELYDEHEDKIKLLLMDMNMPKLNGVEAALQIRQKNPRLPVLFMSGYPRQDVIDRFEEQSCVEFIKKPFNNTGFAEAVRSIIDG